MAKYFKICVVAVFCLFCINLLATSVMAEDENKVTEKGKIKVVLNDAKEVKKAFLVDAEGDVIYQIVVDKKSAAICIKFNGKFVEVTGTVKTDDDNDHDLITIISIKEAKPEAEEEE